MADVETTAEPNRTDSSLSADGGRGAAVGGGLDLGDDPELDDLKDAAKEVLQPTQKRAQKVRLTHSLLLDDERGFKQLLRTFPGIPRKGKGEEFRDLALLLQHYAKWLKELYPSNEHFEDVVWKAREVLNQKERLDDGSVSDAKEHLHLFRFKYKSEQERKRKQSEAGDEGSALSDEKRQKIEENRKKALEKKRQREAAAAAPTAAAASHPAGATQLDDPFMNFEDDPFFGGEEEDVFGFGCDFDDDFGPTPRPAALAELAASEVAATDTVVERTRQDSDVAQRIAENRAKALEKKRQKAAQEGAALAMTGS
mmetsp:Transcript_17474/g.39355  ORF Transcript_17474/g.39355 Transcript_17474/m.39355 type:complete len:312 (+) Transcript_17474:42-977(+)